MNFHSIKITKVPSKKKKKKKLALPREGAINTFVAVPGGEGRGFI